MNGAPLALGAVALLAVAGRSRSGVVSSWDAMRLDPGPALVTPEGVVGLRQIGRGMFSTIYQRIDPGDEHGMVYAVVMRGVWDKHIAAEAHGYLPDNPHLPAVETLGALVDGRSVHRMPFYRTPYRSRDAKPEDARAFKIIQACADEVRAVRGQTGFDTMNRVISCIEERGGVPPDLLEAIEVLAAIAPEHAKAYDMEFTPRNAATDYEGNLVLLDLLFDRNALRRRRAQISRRERGG